MANEAAFLFRKIRVRLLENISLAESAIVIAVVIRQYEKCHNPPPVSPYLNCAQFSAFVEMAIEQGDRSMNRLIVHAGEHTSSEHRHRA